MMHDILGAIEIDFLPAGFADIWDIFQGMEWVFLYIEDMLPAAMNRQFTNP